MATNGKQRASAPQVISNADDLRGLSVWPLKRPPFQPAVALAENVAPQDERLALEKELNMRLFACGCAEGTMGVMLAVGAYAVYAAFAGPADLDWTAHAGRVFAVAFVGAVVGKIAGLYRAERALKQTIASLRARLPQRDRSKLNELGPELTCY